MGELMGVVYIMWLRQLKRYWRSRARMIGSVGQPLLFLIALGFGLGPIYQRAGAGNYLDFLVPGVIAMSILFRAMFTGMEIIWDRQFGFLKETLVAPVPRFKIMLGKTLGGATVAMVQGLIVLIITIIIGFRIASFSSFLIALVFMFFIAVLFTALGTAIASKLEDMQAFPLIMNLIIMPIFFLSGALFPLEGLPSFLDIIIKFNPLTYGVDGLRGALSGSSSFSLPFDLLVIVSVVVVVFYIGSVLFSKIEV